MIRGADAGRRRVALRPATRDTLLVAVGSLLLYCLLHREALHPPDSHRYLQQVFHGDVVSHHFLYLRCAVVFARMTMPFGLDVFASMLLFSALGASLAAAVGHRALLCLSLDRTRAHLGAWIAATCPGVLYFATTVEIHAPFLLLANAAWWSAAAASDASARRNLPGAVRTGVVTALAAGFHATGHALLGPLVLLLWLRGRRIVDAAVVVATHGVAIWLLAVVVTGGTQSLRASAGTLGGGVLSGLFVRDAFGILWNEWLRAFLPVSMVGLYTLVAGPVRRDSLLVHLALVPYLVIAVAMLKGIVEYGAYVLPMALPLAWLSVRALPLRLAALCLLIGLGSGILLMQPFREDPAEAAYAADALACDREQGIHVFAATKSEVDALARCAPSIPSEWILMLGAARDLPAEMFPALCESWDQSIARIVAGGRRPVFTAATLDYLRQEPGGLLSRMMKEHVDQRFAWHPVDHGTFQAFEPRTR